MAHGLHAATQPVTQGLRILVTACAVLAIGILLFALIYAGVPAVLYLGDVLGGAQFSKTWSSAVHLVGMAAIVGCLILIGAIAFFVIMIIKMWRAAGRAATKEDGA